MPLANLVVPWSQTNKDNEVISATPSPEEVPSQVTAADGHHIEDDN
ncbi:unnamed protein product, partial [Medioppia subpectinata]